MQNQIAPPVNGGNHQSPDPDPRPSYSGIFIIPLATDGRMPSGNAKLPWTLHEPVGCAGPCFDVRYYCRSLRRAGFAPEGTSLEIEALTLHARG